MTPVTRCTTVATSAGESDVSIIGEIIPGSDKGIWKGVAWRGSKPLQTTPLFVSDSSQLGHRAPEAPPHQERHHRGQDQEGRPDRHQPAAEELEQPECQPN